MRRQQFTARIAIAHLAVLSLPVGSAAAAGGRACGGTEGRTVSRAMCAQQAARSADTESPIGLIHRVAVLPDPAVIDSYTAELIASARAQAVRRNRSLFAFRPKAGASAPRPAPKAPAPPRPAVPDEAQARAVAAALFADNVTAQLGSRLDMEVISADRVQAALKARTGGAISREGIAGLRALCEEIHCDALLLPVVDRVAVTEGKSRFVGLWMHVEILTSSVIQPGATPVTFYAAAAGRGDAGSFGKRFGKEWSQLFLETAKRAAGITIRAMASGMQPPFARREERVALLPTAVPDRIGEMHFGPTRREAAVQRMPDTTLDQTSQFHPDLSPLSAERVVSGDRVALALRQLHRSAQSVWTEGETPDRDLMVSLGRLLSVDYVAAARVQSVELSVQEPVSAAERIRTERLVQFGEAPYRRTGAAQCVGVLVRVSDGALLWKESSEATISDSGSDQNDRTARRRLVRDAMKFSLRQLERKFALFRRKYE